MPESDAGAARQPACGVHFAGIGKGAQAVQQHIADSDGKRGVRRLLSRGVNPADRLGVAAEVVHGAIPKWALASSLIISGDHLGS